MTASTGRTALAIVAILTLLLSLVAITRPVIAAHDVPGPVPGSGPTLVTPENPNGYTVNPGGNVECPSGTTELTAESGGSVTLPGETEPTVVTYTISGNQVTNFTVTNGLAAYVFVKATDATNVYNYTAQPGGGIAHDDGLISPATDSVSHVTFCLIPLPKGSILIYKNDQTGAPVGGATFSVSGEEDGVITTDADGFGCLDELPFGDYTVTETLAPDGWVADPDTENVTVGEESTCDERLEGAVIADADATFTNTLLGSLLVLKTDDSDATLDGATFTVRNEAGMVVGSFTSGDDGDGLFCVDGLVFGDEYEVTEDTAPDGYSKDITNPRTHTIDVSDDCETREDGPDLTFVNIEDEDLGSITVIKEIDCEICETSTWGRWFNSAPGGTTPGGTAADASLLAHQITLNGEVFDSTADVEAQFFANPGLESQLFIQWFGLQMNLRGLAENGDPECNLGSLVHDGENADFHDMTVQEISDMAEALLDADLTAVDTDLHEVIEEINSSSTDDGTLICAGADDTNGFTFELRLNGTAVRSGETGEDEKDGQIFWDEVPFGTYTLVETGGGPADLDCEVVDAFGDGVTFVGGVITITVDDENTDVIVTVVNECAPPPPPPPVVTVLGSITIIKDAAPNNAQDFAFTTTGTGLLNFSLDDDADAELSNSRTFSGLAAGSYAVTESAIDGWTLTSITCSTGGTGNTTTRTASITLAAGANVTCTFLNTEQGEDVAGGGGGPAPTPTPTTSREGTLGGSVPNTAMESPPVGGPSVLLLALLMLTASLTSAAYVTGMEGRRPR